MEIIKKIIKKLIFIRRKILVYIYYTAKPLYINPIWYFRKYFEYSSEKEFKKIDNGELYNLVLSLLQKSKSTGCEYADYYEIYRAIEKRKANQILELGSGISTCIIAYALMKKEKATGIKGEIVTMEESEFYYQQFLDIIPENLKKYITAIYSPRKTSYFDEKLGCYYEDIPSREAGYDFVFIDAPTEYYPTDKQKCFDADLINLINEKKLNNPFIILDQRIGTFWALNELVPNLNLKYNPFKKHSTTILTTNNKN